MTYLTNLRVAEQLACRYSSLIRVSPTVGRKAASQREAQLLDASDQCRGMLEDQVATLRKQVAMLEHDLTSAKVDLKDNQQRLRERVSLCDLSFGPV